jgi:hypothetical protein
MNGTSTEQFLPDLQSIRSDADYLKHLRKCLWDCEYSISQGVEAIPALEQEIREIEDAREASSAALATLLSSLERVSALATIGPQNRFLQSHIPPPTARSSASYTLAEFTAYHSTIPTKLDDLRQSLETARVAVHSGGAHHKRLQKVIKTTVDALKAKYELVHPIHRLPRTLLTRIFALVVSEEYAAADYSIAVGREVRLLISPTRLSTVCHYWRETCYATESLWNRIFVTTHSPPSPFRPTEEGKPAFVIAVDGNDSPQGGGGSLVTRHIQSLASLTSILELTYGGSAFESVQECLVMLPCLKRLCLTYAKWKSDPVIIALPGTLHNLTYLSCIDAYPSFSSTLAALETLEIIVRPKGREKPPPLDYLLAKAPNLKSLLLFRTPDLELGSEIEHYSLTSIKGTIGPIADALRDGRLSLPKLSSLELYITNWSVLREWEELFPPGSWTSQIVNLRLEFANRVARSECPDAVHKMLAPFSSLRSLLIVSEDRPQLFLSASRQVFLPKLTHIKVENCACDGVALLNKVKEYNNREDVLSGEVSRLTHVELINCPNITVGVMKQLRTLNDVKHAVSDQARKHEEFLSPSAMPPQPPSPLSLVVSKALSQAPQPLIAERYVLGEETPQREVSVQGDATALSETPPPVSLRLETPPQSELGRPEDEGQVPEVPPTSPRPHQKIPLKSPHTPAQAKRWSDMIL